MTNPTEPTSPQARRRRGRFGAWMAAVGVVLIFAQEGATAEEDGALEEQTTRMQHILSELVRERDEVGANAAQAMKEGEGLRHSCLAASLQALETAVEAAKLTRSNWPLTPGREAYRRRSLERLEEVRALSAGEVHTAHQCIDATTLAVEFTGAAGQSQSAPDPLSSSGSAVRLERPPLASPL